MLEHVMKTLFQSLLSLLLLCIAVPGYIMAQQVEEPVDREYRLEASILGYKGIGGDIDGVRNPVLEAYQGETVKITIVNVEVLAHDVALESAGVKSNEIIDVGEVASVTFVAEADDIYYCTIPGHRAAGMEGRFQLIDDAGLRITGLPVIKNGRELNLGFELGDLSDWTREGEAFGGEPVEGDVIYMRSGEKNSRHQGSFWISSGEANGHRPEGTMTSESFTVTQPFASFLVGGGALADVRVELVKAATEEVFFDISGPDNESMRPVVVDLEAVQGEEMYIRLVDGESGTSEIPYISDNKLAYISFDDFRFYASRPSFTNEFTRDEIYIMPPILEVPNAGLSGEAAAANMEVPDGFTVTLAAAEPDVVRPIAFTYDDRGRIWVVEAHTYPEPAPEGEGRDRVLIFEDTNGDGTLDSRKVFMEGLNLVSGMELGFGGVWLGAAPYLLYVPIDPDTDKPAGPAQIKLDGWGTRDTHETLNSLRWGPDGWLYGAHGVFTPSEVGVPGTPAAERVKLNGAVWRYHPKTEKFELWAEGTSNPWGIDFNAYGHPFITACVIPHLYHVIPGGRYQRQAYEHFNPYTYDDIKTHADHVHWVGERGPHAGNHRSDEAGGGHAHAGAMVYLGGSWPEAYHGKLFMNNIHGFRANVDHLERKGSGYEGVHGDDFLFANDSWSQMLNFKYGPDGSVHVIDWYDKNQCHSPNPDVHDKTLGRIFKISHENDVWVNVDMQTKTNQELVSYLAHENEWYVRRARRILQEREAGDSVQEALQTMLADSNPLTHRLRALWTLYSTGMMDDADLVSLTYDEEEVFRSWAVQLIGDDGEVSADALERFESMAAEDPSAMVRLYLASALQRVEPAERWGTLAALYARSEDANDHNLPIMTWYAAEPAIPGQMDHALMLALDAEIPSILDYTVRRIASMNTPEALETLAAFLGRTADKEKQQIILNGLNEMVGGTE